MYLTDLTSRCSIKEIEKAIVASLDDSLLKPEWKKVTPRNDVTGHCYAASEAMFYLTGGSKKWTPQVGKDESGCTHWWLLSKETGKITDPTSSQFTDFGKEPPYANGKGCGFQQQSDRCKEIIRRVYKRLDLDFDLKDIPPQLKPRNNRRKLR